MKANEDVAAAGKASKNRKKGSESVRKDRKRLKLADLPHTNYKGKKISAKKAPVAEVDEKHWEIIVNFVENYPVVATGKFQGPNGKVQYRKLWEELTLQLNSAGLGQRTTEKWQKTWTDFKYTLKKKASAYQQGLHHTGGGAATIPKVTELVVRILNVLGTTFYAGLADIKEMGVGGNVENPEELLNVPSTSKPAEDNLQSPHASATECSTKRLKSYGSHTHSDHNYSQIKRKREEQPDHTRKLVNLSEQTLQELKEIKEILREGLANIADAIRSVSDTNK
ncbi:hypothetical protein RN001_005754 [Aquatica leii]|uniref:Regulatory protein zeste n=1 Tax=Aquatica leii TaxID=1421715 RepID=A0AAN7SS45_9COLE|nr:hypothetical protein RN001_005754 [Aquatica leii]